MAAGRTDLSPLDEHALHTCRCVQRIAVGNDDTGQPTGRQRIQAVGHAQDLSRVQRDREQRLAARQAEYDSRGCFMRLVALVGRREGAAVACDAENITGLGQQCRQPDTRVGVFSQRWSAGQPGAFGRARW